MDRSTIAIDPAPPGSAVSDGFARRRMRIDGATLTNGSTPTNPDG